MKRLKRFFVLMFATLTASCFCACLGIAFAAENTTPYEKIGGLEGHITASTTLNGDTAEKLNWELSKMANAGRGAWTAQWGWTANPSCDEWIKIDLTLNKTIGKIVLHNESGLSYARKLVIYGSTDDKSFFELARYENGDEDWNNDKSLVFEFSPATVRYLKISLREKGQNGTNYLVSMSEIEVFTTTEPLTHDYESYTEIETSVTADETLTDFTLEPLSDGITADQTSQNGYWAGGWKNGAKTDKDYLIFDTGKINNLGGIKLFPRCSTTDSSKPCVPFGFPTNFAFYSSDDGTEYKLIKNQSYANYSAGLSWNEFMFNKPIKARYIKMMINERGEANGVYLTQLAEAKIYEANFEPVVNYTKLTVESSTCSGNWTETTTSDKAYDGNVGTAWVAPWGYSQHQYADEFIQLDYGAEKIIGKIILKVDTVNIPSSISIKMSKDGNNFATVYTDYNCVYENSQMTIIFDSIQARYLKIEIYKKGANGANYLAGFTEIEAYEADDSEETGSPIYFEDITNTVSSKVVSSQTGENDSGKLTDGITANKTASTNEWMSNISATATVDASDSDVGFDGFFFGFDETTKIDKLSLFPRIDGVPGSIIGFPVNFTITYSNDGQIWYKANNNSFDNYEAHEGWNDFEFAKTIEAKYIGVFVEVRGKNGEAYTIELSEVKVFKAMVEREIETDSEILFDNSVLEVKDFTPELSNYTYEDFDLILDDYFTYSLNINLVYNVDTNNGKIEVKDGKTHFVAKPTTVGEFNVKITCYPEGKEDKAGTLEFTLNVISKDDPDVIAIAYNPSMNYAVGVTFRIELGQLFVYEGKAELIYSSNKGKIEKIKDKTYLVYTTDKAGEIEISITATPTGKLEKAKINTIKLNVVENVNSVSSQPPVYDVNGNTGCSATNLYAAAAMLLTAIGAAVVLLRKGK